MIMSTVVGVFESEERAKEAIQALQDEGFTEEEVSIVAKGDDSNQGSSQGMVSQDNMADGAAWGGGIGAVGGLLAGMGALAIPGIGPIVAAGPLAAALSGAVAGGVAGGLIDMGIPEAEGKRFEQDIKEGRMLAVIEADDDNAEIAQNLLEDYGADEVQVY
jgi:outer membrane lipoprotein SlyB